MPRDGFQLNICFSLALGLVWGHWLREQSQRVAADIRYLKVAAPLIAGSVVLWYFAGHWLEYHHWGLLLIPACMLAFQALAQPARALLPTVLAILPVLIVSGAMNSSIMAKSFTLATTLVMLLLAAGAARHVPAVIVKMPRKLWLAWYPAHFAVIALLLHGAAWMAVFS